MLERIELTARGQSLTASSVLVASGLVNEITCIFNTDWQVDELRAVFVNDARPREKVSVVVVNGQCQVPHEVLEDKGKVSVNLVGSVVEGTELVERMTSYKTLIVDVKQKVNVDGMNTVEPTPSEFEQFVERVEDIILLRVDGETLIFGDLPNTRVDGETLIINGGQDEY